ncbi:MAG: hypothetical protein ACYTFY_13040 [Planctomycetota bacterium]|jgi:hypothetical protein
MAKRKPRTSIKKKFTALPKPVRIGIGAVFAVIMLCFITSGEEKVEVPEDVISEETFDIKTADKTIKRIERLHKTGSGLSYREIKEKEKAGKGKVKKLDEQKRQAAAAEAIKTYIMCAREQWKFLTPEEKKQMIEKGRTQAAKVREKIDKMTPEKRAKVKEYINRPESKAWVDKMRDTFMNDLSAEERKTMAPIVKEWMGVLEDL